LSGHATTDRETRTVRKRRREQQLVDGNRLKIGFPRALREQQHGGIRLVLVVNVPVVFVATALDRVPRVVYATAPALIGDA
jgi:hypothetical protein